MCVCPQGGRGVCLSACWDTPPGRQTPPDQAPPDQALPDQATPPGVVTPPRADTPTPLDQAPPRSRNPLQSRHPPGSRLQHTVNERPVRILLECILVCTIYPPHQVLLDTLGETHYIRQFNKVTGIYLWKAHEFKITCNDDVACCRVSLLVEVADPRGGVGCQGCKFPWGLNSFIFV